MVARFSGTNAVDIGGGRMGFRDRNLAAGLIGSIPNAIWMNGIQETMLSPIETAGLTPSDSDQTLGTRALRRIAAANVTTITATGALTLDMAGLLFVNASAGNIVLTLPAPFFFAGNFIPVDFEFARTDTSSNTVTLVPNNSTDLFQPGALNAAALATNPCTLLPGEWLTLRSDAVSSWWGTYRGKRRLVYTASTTLTVPPFFVRAGVEVWGGAGGSGGTTGTNSASGGGGGGGYARRRISGLIPNTDIPITVGIGGNAGTGGGTPTAGTGGGSSSFGPYVSATGGGGSVGANTTIGTAGTSGTGIGGDFNVSATTGLQGFPGPSGSWIQGAAGGTFGTPPAPNGSANVSLAGGTGNFPGGGATGSLLASNGGAGAGGCVIVELES